MRPGESNITLVSAADSSAERATSRSETMQIITSTATPGSGLIVQAGDWLL
jgi:hypothetical protein